MRRAWIWLASAGLAVAVGYLIVAGWIASSGLVRIVGLDGPLADIELQRRSPFDLNFDGDPTAALDLPFEEIDVATQLGPAKAWIVPVASEARPGLWMVYVHGIAGRRESGYKALSVANELGVTVLLASYRNDDVAPKSPAGIYGFGIAEWPDLEAAVAAAERRGANRIILAGDSMGGAIIGEFLARSRLAERVVALALDAPALDIGAVVAGLTARMGLPLPTFVGWTARRFLAYRLPIDISDARTLPTVADFSGPVMTIHGTADSIVPVTVSDELVARRTGPTVYLRTNADHVVSWQEDPDRYRQTMRAFLASVLKAQ